MSMNDIVENSLLFDFYGSLLTEKKRRVLEMYHDSDMSLSEIAGATGVSRAAVYDSLKAAEKQMVSYEEKLGLVEKYIEREKASESMVSRIDEICKMESEDPAGNRNAVIKELEKLRTEISRMSGE